MSETKSNVALGASVGSVALVGYSHFTLKARICELEDSMECLRQDLVDLAQVVKTTKKMHEEQITQTSTGLRSLSTKVRKLEKSTGSKGVDKELASIRSDVDSILKSITEGTPVTDVFPVKESRKDKKKKAEADFDSYLDSFTK